VHWRVKPGAVMVNVARGGAVDDASLAAALRACRPGGAALGVFEEEPLSQEGAENFADWPISF